MVIKQLESISIRIDRVVYITNTCIFIYVYVCEVLVIARGRWECVVIKQLEKSGSDLSELIIIHMTHFKIEVRSLCKGVSKILTAYRI